MPVLTAVDLARIQQYVFSSNRLRDVLAASYAIEQALDPERGLKRPLESVILAGGGNALLQFHSLDEALRWTRDFTRRLQEVAPEVDAVIAHRRFGAGRLAQAWLLVHADLAREKLQRRPGVPQLGLSVTATCAVTGLPATAVDDEGQLVSRRIHVLRFGIENSKKRWRAFLPGELENAPGWSAVFPDDLDELGRTAGETSLIGVVHVDGNDVGELIRRWLEMRLDASDDQVKQEAQEWSSALKAVGDKVLRRLVQRIARCIREGRRRTTGGIEMRLEGQPEELSFALRRAGSQSSVFLPLRPIVLGGDDMTFVADGRIALDLAVTALREFERSQVPHLGEGGDPATITACAGVAMVRSHAPFYRAYQAAKMLCGSAKSARRKAADDGGWLDWILGSPQPAQGIERLRAPYRVNGQNLTMRPYRVTRAVSQQGWDWLDLEVLGPGPEGNRAQGFRGHPAWRYSRNRVKQLEALAREGREAVCKQLAVWRATEAGLELPGRLNQGGFLDGKTPLVDAIEIMDLHLRLEAGAT